METDRKSKIVTVIVFVVALGILTGIFFWFSGEMTDKIEENTNRFLSENADALAAVFYTKLDDQMIMLESQARFFEDVDLSNYAKMKETMLNTKGIGAFKTIGVASAAGSTITYDGVSSGNIYKDDYFKEAMSGKNAISATTVLDEDGDEVLVMAVPIWQNGAVAGVVYGTFTQSSLNAMIDTVRFAETGANILITLDGTILAKTQESSFLRRVMTKLHEQIPTLEIPTDGTSSSMNFTYLHQDYILFMTPVGAHNWYFVSIIPREVVTDQSSQVLGYVLELIGGVVAVFIILVFYIFFLTSHHENMQKSLTEKAHEDSLTGLFNKIAFEQEVEKELLIMEENEYGVFYIIDLDNFKKVNDNLGHAIGDKVILDVAEKLKHIFRETDLGRIGGDEFAAFFHYASETAEHFETMIRKRADDMVRELHQVYENDGKSVTVSVSIGIARCPEDGREFKDLYVRADQALYHAKKKGKNRYELYRPTETTSI